MDVQAVSRFSDGDLAQNLVLRDRVILSTMESELVFYASISPHCCVIDASGVDDWATDIRMVLDADMVLMPTLKLWMMDFKSRS